MPLTQCRAVSTHWGAITLPEQVNEPLLNTAAAHGAGLVTTEKDWARLPADWRARVTAWPVRARFKDEAALDALLSRQL